MKRPKASQLKRKQFLQITAIIGTMIGVTLLVATLYLSYEITRPRGGASMEPIVVQIAPNSSIDKIASQLAEQKLIDSTIAFGLYARFGSAHGKLIPGPYRLTGNMSIKQIVEMMAEGKVAVIKITVPEGVTVNKIGRLWVANSGKSDADFDTALSQSYDFAFLQDRTAATSLEGYLAPATYQVPYGASSHDLIEQMLKQFDDKVKPVLYGPNQSGLKPAEVLTLASIVEREASDTVNRKLIAGVFLNRLARGIKLQSDVTVNYATGKTVAVPADLNIKSPYNTYVVPALPIGPVNNPSLDSIEAVLEPTRSDYLFFLAGNDGKIHYAQTNAEHEANIDRYLR